MDRFYAPVCENAYSNGDYVGKYVQIGGQCLGEDIDGYEAYALIRIYELADGFSAEDLARAAFSDHGWCGHEHDCCGCIRRSVSKVRRVGKNDYRVEYYGIRNV